MSNNSFAGISFGNKSKAIDEMREKYTCHKWNNPITMALDSDCEVKVAPAKSNNVRVQGILAGGMRKSSTKVFIKYWAASPPTWGMGFAGSGLPYSNESIAFDNTPNKGVMPSNGLEFSFEIRYPNSYYTEGGSTKVLPEVQLRFVNATGEPLSKIHRIPVGNDIPYRSLTWPRQRDWNEGPMFYDNPDIPIVDQSTLLMMNRYPEDGKEYPHFWGTRYTR